MWKTTITINTTNPKVGTLSATWTDATLGETFTFSQDQVNVDSVAAFKSAAVAAKDQWVSRRTAIKAKEAQLDTFMNT